MERKNSLSVPIAVVIAGVLIAGAIFFSNRDNTNGKATVDMNNNQGGVISSGEITIDPVSQKDYIRGNPDAQVVIVEFSDTECPFCKRFHGTLKTLIDKFGKDGTVAWVYRNYPIKELHSKAPKEAEALLCAGKIGGQVAFWDYTDRLYALTPSNNGLDEAQLPAIAKELGLNQTAFATCLSSGEMTPAVQAQYEDAVKSGGNGTPYSVIISKTAFDRKEVNDFLIPFLLKYKLPAELFVFSNDNKMIGVSGAMPNDIMEGLVSVLIK